MDRSADHAEIPPNEPITAPFSGGATQSLECLEYLGLTLPSILAHPKTAYLQNPTLRARTATTGQLGDSEASTEAITMVFKSHIRAYQPKSNRCDASHPLI